jgi:DNA-binding transcriptional LysR family regulator
MVTFNIKLATLRYFIAVAETLHFGKAATKLHISQPPLSKHIHGLEEELGVMLFRRTKRRVELTNAGVTFLSLVTPILDRLHESIQITQRAARGEIGQLAVGFMRGSADYALPLILSAVGKELPEVKIVLHEMPVGSQIEALANGTIDIGVWRAPISDPRIDTVTILKEPLVAAIPTSHRLAHRKTLRLRELALENFVVLKPGGTHLSEQVSSMCFNAGFTPIAAQQASSVLSLVALVRAGMGVAIVPESTRESTKGGVVYKHLVGEPSRVESAVAWRASNMSELVQRVISICKSRFKNSETTKSGKISTKPTFHRTRRIRTRS